jgi:cardiolipin synthase A/B
MPLRKRTKVILTIIAVVIIAIVIFHDFSKAGSVEKEIVCDYGIRDPQFVRSMDNLLGPSIRDGNKIETLLNGKTFDSMLQAIEQAKKSITFETYIYWSGQIGRKFTDALSKKAKEGVRIHVLLDWVGSGRMDKDLLKELEDSGVQLERYHRAYWFTINKFNNRTHRKIMVVDGKIGFTGGIGIADHWLGNADSKEHWRDTHFRFEGPAVAQMQAVFNENWIETRGELLQGEDYFPTLTPVGPEKGQVFKSSPDDGSESARLMYLLTIAAARKSIQLSNAYFVPDDLSIHHLVSAAKRGVKIQLIAPGEVTDTDVVRSASRSRWGELLKAGVKIYEYQPTMFHCKVMVADGIWTSVGSTNFDNRSFRLNDEVNLNIHDEEFAKQQIEIFQDDLKKSHEVTYEEWANRPMWQKFKEWLAGLLHNQL